LIAIIATSIFAALGAAISKKRDFKVFLLRFGRLELGIFLSILLFINDSNIFDLKKLNCELGFVFSHGVTVIGCKLFGYFSIIGKCILIKPHNPRVRFPTFI